MRSISLGRPSRARGWARIKALLTSLLQSLRRGSARRPLPYDIHREELQPVRQQMQLGGKRTGDGAWLGVRLEMGRQHTQAASLSIGLEVDAGDQAIVQQKRQNVVAPLPLGPGTKISTR